MQVGAQSVSLFRGRAQGWRRVWAGHRVSGSEGIVGTYVGLGGRRVCTGAGEGGRGSRQLDLKLVQGKGGLTFGVVDTSVMELCAICFAALKEGWDGRMSTANRGRDAGGVWIAGYVRGWGQGGGASCAQYWHGVDMVLQVDTA
jgi:hypothetical protein